MNRWSSSLAAVTVAAAWTLCVAAPPAGSSDVPEGAARAARAVRAVSPEPSAAAEGAFLGAYAPIEQPDEGAAARGREIMRGGRYLEEYTELSNALLAIPQDITVRAAQCGHANASYQQRRIVLCYEYAAERERIFTEANAEKDATAPGSTHDPVLADVEGAMLGTYFHELGHAVIDVYDLPTTGNEEDAADELAVLLLLAVDPSGDTTRSTLWAKKLAAREEAGATPDYSDEHALSGQRYYNQLCMLYGSDQVKYAWIVSEEWLPERRAGRCDGEYQQALHSWGQHLAGHWKKQPPQE
ncbi:DUF4344 domain-containing metallopeptidase [Streptomyces sp. NPDC001568]|uniref:DUF4344 domain-containing metallopeptidase n=1 Tax=Streptomyces sp. NPDC001568 TaxID=3364588 RepID=UPI0036969E1E